jgi:hypothetical protein
MASRESTFDAEKRRSITQGDATNRQILAELARLNARLDGPSSGQSDMADAVKNESADAKLREAGFALAWGEYLMPIPGSPYTAHVKQFGPNGWQWLVSSGQVVEDGRVNIKDVDIAIADVMRFAASCR